MLVKVNDTFLDFNDSITIEKKIKLFEEISSTDGDISFNFSIPYTSKNIDIIGTPLPNVSSKIIYQDLPCSLLSDDGQLLYTGSLRIEDIEDTIEAYFFAGNSNWFALFEGTLQDLYLNDYDLDITQANIQATWNDTSGIYFPLIDAGVLSTRKRPDLLMEDFYPFMYVQTVISRIFASAGIKIQGELLSEWRYKHLITAGGLSQETSIENRTSFANKTANQAVAEADGPEAIIYEDDSTDPFYDGSEGNYDTSNGRYTADIGMRVRVEASATFSSTANVYRLTVQKNGFSIPKVRGYGNETIAIEDELTLVTGDYIQVIAEVMNTGGTANVTAGTFKVVPVYLYKVIGGEFLPKLTQQKFVAEIFKLFNVICSFNSVSQVLTINLFEKIASKEPIDLSKYVSGKPRINFTDVVQNYGKTTRFLYAEYDLSEHYNKANEIPFGASDLTIDNAYIEPYVEAIQSEFVGAISARNPAFLTDVNKFNFFELEELTTAEITSVSNNSGQARINMTVTGFTAGELVRIDSTLADYNGDWVIATVGVSYIECNGMQFIIDATGEATALEHIVINNDESYLLLAVPDKTLTDISTLDEFTIELDAITAIGYAYFNLLNNDLDINELTQSLSFGPVANENDYQQKLKDSYFRLFNLVMNDPVKLVYKMQLPYPVFLSIDHLQPAYLKTKEAIGLFYINLITAYEASHLPCEVELIKISAHSQSSTYTEGPAPDAPFDPRYQAVLDYATLQGYTLPSSGQQILGNQLVLDIDALWDDLDLLYVFATDGDSDFAKINWIDPGNFTATEVNSPTFTVNEGFSNTGTSYLSTGWDPATNAVNFALNDAGVFAYCGTDITAANTFLFGSSDSGAVGRVELVPKRLTGENHLFGINSTGTAARGTGPVSSEGFFHIRRTATNDLRIFKDGAQVGTTESFTGTTGPNNDDIYLLATNSNGVVNSHILADIGIFGIGSSLSGQESAIYTAWNTYFTSL
jgi:hypothetical protein